MASNQAPAKKTLTLTRSCERSRLAAAALASAYELLTPILQRALPNSEPAPQAEQRQRQPRGQQA